jgi:hypothetical protein
LASLRLTHLGSLFLDPEDVKSVSDLVSYYGAQKARLKAWVHRGRKGSNPITNLHLNLCGLVGEMFGLSSCPRNIVHTFLRTGLA